MAKQTVNNGDSGLSARNKINENFTELYDLDATLGSAAFADTSDFDAAGAASTSGATALSLANQYTDTQIITTLPGLSDVPAYTGNAGKLLNVNTAENAAEFGK